MGQNVVSQQHFRIFKWTISLEQNDEKPGFSDVNMKIEMKLSWKLKVD